MTAPPAPRALLTPVDVRAAMTLRREWRADPFTDHMAAARLLMSPPKVRALMGRLDRAGELSFVKVSTCGAGWPMWTYRMVADPAPPPGRFDAVDAAQRDAAIWHRLMEAYASIVTFKGGSR